MQVFSISLNEDEYSELWECLKGAPKRQRSRVAVELMRRGLRNEPDTKSVILAVLGELGLDNGGLAAQIEEGVRGALSGVRLAEKVETEAEVDGDDEITAGDVMDMFLEDMGK